MLSIEKIWLTDEAVWIRTTDGRQACERFADYPRLRVATPGQRANYIVDSYGINWPDIDEDLSFDAFFEPKKQSPLYRMFMEHPELNASAVARKLGISQSLFAQYISGAKKPSKKRMTEILDNIRDIGLSLVSTAETYAALTSLSESL